MLRQPALSIGLREKGMSKEEVEFLEFVLNTVKDLNTTPSIDLLKHRAPKFNKFSDELTKHQFHLKVITKAVAQLKAYAFAGFALRQMQNPMLAGVPALESAAFWFNTMPPQRNIDAYNASLLSMPEGNYPVGTITGRVVKIESEAIILKCRYKELISVPVPATDIGAFQVGGIVEIVTSETETCVNVL